MPCLVLSCLVLSCLVFLCLVLPCLVLSIVVTCSAVLFRLRALTKLYPNPDTYPNSNLNPNLRCVVVGIRPCLTILRAMTRSSEPEGCQHCSPTGQGAVRHFSTEPNAGVTRTGPVSSQELSSETGVLTLTPTLTLTLTLTLTPTLTLNH